MRNRYLPPVFLSVCFLLSSCSTVSPERRFETAGEIARSAGLAMTTVKTDPRQDPMSWHDSGEKPNFSSASFILTAYYKLSEPGKPLHIYIEGDGYAWVTPTRVSGDPTPREPMVLKLAAEDPSPNVVYLARPCQYTPMEMNSACDDDAYWTNKRFSEEVVRSMNEAVSYFVNKAQAPGVDLIGYSGGATVAVLITARRQDVKSLRTVAGNLDPELVNQAHGASPLEGSLDPLDVAPEIALIPQLHFIGGDDEIIPFEAAGSFLKKMGDGRCFQTKTLPNASHKDGWVEHWKELLALPVKCSGPDNRLQTTDERQNPK